MDPVLYLVGKTRRGFLLASAPMTQADKEDSNRRLAGILAADVVGYSAMVGRDERATLARVRTLRTDLIESLADTHGGRLFKTTGDGFLAAFASTVQALRCAIAVQEKAFQLSAPRARVRDLTGSVGTFGTSP